MLRAVFFIVALSVGAQGRTEEEDAAICACAAKYGVCGGTCLDLIDIDDQSDECRDYAIEGVCGRGPVSNFAVLDSKSSGFWTNFECQSHWLKCDDNR